VKTRLFSFLILSLSIGVTLRAADEITLKSGKTITGRITAETDKSYTVKFGSNMYLSVEKSDVARVTRDEPAKSQKQIIRMEQPKSASPVASTPTAKSPAAAPAAPADPKRSNEGVNIETVKVGVVSIQKIFQSKVNLLEGRTFAQLENKLNSGAASKTVWKAEWTGKPGAGGKKWAGAVVVASITVTLPAWNTPPGTPPADTEKWNAYIKQATEHEAGHAEIIHDGLVSFGQSASNLSEKSEADLRRATTALFTAIQDQVAKRRQGFDRRLKRPAPKKK
jgi:predicted secreted Zn-dependent protease